MSRALPHQRVPIAEAGGTASNPFYAFLQDVERALQDGTLDVSGLQAQIDAIKAQLEEEDPTIGLLLGQQSIRVIGQLKDGNSFVMLEGDSDEPGPTYAYGTDAAGAKGWHPVSAAMLQGTGVVLTVGVDGVTTFDLAELADSGTGTFKLITRDSYGRVSGTADGTTSDVPEGSNLYHTAARVRATVLTGLSTATNAVITAADTVLGALGKLQAQISGIASSLGNYVLKSGDTMTGDLLVSKPNAVVGVGIGGTLNGGLANYAAAGTGDVGLFAGHPLGNVRLRPDGRTSGAGEILVTTSGFWWDGNEAWHGGNFDPSTKADLDGGNAFTGTQKFGVVEITEIFPRGDISVQAPAGNNAVLDFSPNPLDGTSASTVRCFRTSTTTGPLAFVVSVGNGTSQSNHQLGGNQDSFLSRYNNLALFGLGSFGGGTLVQFIGNVSTPPSANPTGGGIVYVEAGALKYRGSSGTTTTIAPA